MVACRSWLKWLVISWLGAVGPALLAGEPRAQASCPNGSRSEMLGGVALCIPPGNDRYLFKSQRLALFWRGDERVSSSSDEPIDQEAMTVAMTPWGSEGERDGFADTISVRVLQAAAAAGVATTFEVELSVKDKLDRVRFERLAGGALRGRHQATDDDTVIFVREAQAGQQPDLMICSDARGRKVPNNTCLAYAQIGGKAVGVLVLGHDADRAFRLLEEMVADLRSFAVPAAP